MKVFLQLNKKLKIMDIHGFLTLVAIDYKNYFILYIKY